MGEWIFRLPVHPAMHRTAIYHAAAASLKTFYGGPTVHAADLGFYAALWLGANHPEYLSGLIQQYAQGCGQAREGNLFALFWPAFMAEFPLTYRTNAED